METTVQQKTSKATSSPENKTENKSEDQNRGFWLNHKLAVIEAPTSGMAYLALDFLCRKDSTSLELRPIAKDKILVLALVNTEDTTTVPSLASILSDCRVTEILSPTKTFLESVYSLQVTAKVENLVVLEGENVGELLKIVNQASANGHLIVEIKFFSQGKVVALLTKNPAHGKEPQKIETHADVTKTKIEKPSEKFLQFFNLAHF